MNATARTMETRTTTATAEVRPLFSVAEIDASCRAPLLLLFVSGAVWLLISSVLGLFAGIKSHVPGFFADSAWLTFGRVRPAAMNALVYGFAIQTFLGILTWIICRLGRLPLLGANAATIGGIIWNFGVTVGVLGILAGGSTSFEWFEMPRMAPPLLFAGFTVIAICALVTFHFRREPDLYVSHWFLIGGLFWFVWVYSAAALLLIYFPVRGVMQAVVDAWYVNNVLHVFFGFTGLGIAFYFIPKLLVVPLKTSTMAIFAFWTLALFAPWSGLVSLLGGPIPAWMLSTSVFANVMLIAPLMVVIMILADTGRQKAPAAEPLALRFIKFGAWSYVLVLAGSILLGVPIIARVTRGTWVEPARNLFALYGFVAMLAFGAVYYIVPRLARVNWPSPKLVNVHFWCSAIGAGLICAALTIGGITQGFKMNIGVADFVSLGKLSAPFLGMTSLGFFILIIGQGAFLKNLLTLLHVWGEPARRVVIETVREEMR
jgi:cytochrome c oxidase cbb3-type subunit I